MSIAALLYLLIYILVLGLVMWLILYLINLFPLPAPFGQVARAIVMVIACLILIVLLLNFAGIAVPIHS